jgi:hypothetical protein
MVSIFYRSNAGSDREQGCYLLLGDVGGRLGVCCCGTQEFDRVTASPQTLNYVGEAG